MSASGKARALNWPLTLEFIRRELRLRWLGTFSGAAWALLQPLMQLAIYSYVFLYIFRARLPQEEFGELGFVPFLAIGLWPWTAFSEACLRAVSAIPDNAGLLGKVALPRPLLVLAPVVSGFLLHAVGLFAVIAILIFGGWLPWSWSILAVPLLLALLALFALGLSWLLAALNVFVRDLSHLLGQLMLMLFFLTPVLYPRSLVPDALGPVADANPLALYIGLFRQVILGTGGYDWQHWLLAIVIALATAAAGWWIFQRLSPYFEDFL